MAEAYGGSALSFELAPSAPTAQESKGRATQDSIEFAELIKDGIEQMDTLDKGALALTPVPFVGDAAGVANDVRNYLNGKVEATPANLGLSVLGVIPFVPSFAGIIGRASPEVVEKYLKAAQERMKRKGVTEPAQLEMYDHVELHQATGAYIDAEGNVVSNYTAGKLQLNEEYQKEKAKNSYLSATHFMGTEPWMEGGKIPTRTPSATPNTRRTNLEDFITGLPSFPGITPSDVPVREVPTEEIARGVKAQYYPSIGEIAIAPATKTEIKSQEIAAAHEYTHLVAKNQGLAGGTSGLNFLPPEVRQGKRKATFAEEKAAYQQYKRNTGEVYARAASEYDASYAHLPKAFQPDFRLFLELEVRSILSAEEIAEAQGRSLLFSKKLNR